MFQFFSQLLYADAIPWSVMSAIVITEETTSSSSRIFIKILFQELSQYMGLPKVYLIFLVFDPPALNSSPTLTALFS